MKRTAFAATAACCLAALLLACGVGFGQTPSTTPTSFPSVAFADPGFGYELQLPAGWEYDRSRFQQFKDSIGLLRGHAPGGRRGVQIMVFRSFDMKPFEDWIVDFGKATAELTNSPRVDWETWRLPPRAGVVLSYGSKLGAINTRSHCLCLPFDPSTVWVLVYSGNVARDEETSQIRAEFEQIIASLRVHYDADEAERLTPAFDRGKALLARLRREAAKVRPDETEHVYDMVLAGSPIGYFTRCITREEYVFGGPSASRRDAKDGIRVRERSWRFGEDGAARHTRIDLFSSFDLESELIEVQQTDIPPREMQPQEILVRTDQVIREKDVLLTSQSTSRDAHLPDPGKPVRVGPVYLDQAWVRLLAGLLQSGPQELHALAIYDTETRALLTHTIEPLGVRALEGYDGVAYAYQLRQGFIDRPSLIYCDEHGGLLRLEAGELVVTRVSRRQADQQYGVLRDEAQRRFGLQLE